jgi:zinc transport system permease protein
MEWIYEWIGGMAQNGYLPDIFEHAFMIRGMIAALLIGPALGGMGTVVVTKKLSFFTQTIGNASLTGVAIGLLFGEPIDGTYAGLFGFCLIVALMMTYIKNRSRISNDTVIGVMLAQTLGLGIVMLVMVTQKFNIHQIEAILFGSLITLSENDLLLLAVTTVVAMIIGNLTFNRIVLVSFNPIMAKVRGRNPIFYEYLFITVLTAVVVASLKLIGALLVLVLIVVPAASAQNIAGNFRQFFWISMLFSTISTTGGLLLSGTLPVPTGAAIVLVASVLFYVTLVIKPLLGRSSLRQVEA